MMADGTDQARIAFGCDILGPVFADFALRLWTFLSALDQPDDTTILFCARGGLRLREVYNRFLAASGLPSPVASRDLMVSRIVAVRSALMGGHQAAYEQIGYELGGSTLGEVALALASDPALLPPQTEAWEQPYDPERLSTLLASPACQPLRQDMQQQTELFRLHLARCTQRRRNAVLCDTGLSGSTMQLLAAAIPELTWGCTLFARSNYKRLSTAHFSRTFGLSVQADEYSPISRRSAILRYWHLIEATLEPYLRSVTTFEPTGDHARSNLEVPGWEKRVAPAKGEIFEGILKYVDSLPYGEAPARVIEDAKRAYAKLHRVIIWPTHAEGALLDLGSRSLDFGRVDLMSGRVCEPGVRAALSGSLWREGALALAAPGLRLPLLAAVQTLYSARWALKLGRNRR